MKGEHPAVHKSRFRLSAARLQDPADTRPRGPFLSFDSRINLSLKIIYVIITPDSG